MRDAFDKFEKATKAMPENGVRDDPSLQTAVRVLFIGSAPERESDLIEMWKELDLKFQLTPNLHEGDRIIMDAGAYRYVRFNHRVLRAFWIAAYAAWEGYRTVAESPSLQALDLTRFRELISSYESCLASEEADLAALQRRGNIPIVGMIPNAGLQANSRQLPSPGPFCTNYGISGTSARERALIPLVTIERPSTRKSYLATNSRRPSSWSRSICTPKRQASPQTLCGKSASLESTSDCSPSRC